MDDKDDDEGEDEGKKRLLQKEWQHQIIHKKSDQLLTININVVYDDLW